VVQNGTYGIDEELKRIEIEAMVGIIDNAREGGQIAPDDKGAHLSKQVSSALDRGMWPLLAAIGPRLLIPGVFLGPKVASMTDRVQQFQTVAFYALFVTFAVTLFSENYALSVIPGIAALAYWYMMKEPAKTQRYRYMDWAATTPLILAAILLKNGASWSTVGLYVLLDLVMIGAGYQGVQSKENKRMWFILGCVVFVPILLALLDMKRTKSAVYLTLLLWILYPLVWVSEEERLIETSTSNECYTVMDVVAKAGLVVLL